MKVFFSGGSGEVGASCVLINVDGKNLVFDCGIRMTSDDQLPDLQLIKDSGGVDAIFLSHAHMDHSGCLPVLSREYPEAKIYMTHATKDLIKVLLYDSLKIMDSREFEIPVFAEVHVENMLNRILCYSPDYTFKPFDNDISVTFHSAGHVLGASSIYVVGKEGTIFYSGDFSVFKQRTVEGAFIGKLRPDISIFESTYGERLHSNRKIEENRLIEKVGEVIESGNKILIPAFALGRAQEIILILKSAINKGTLKPFRIYVDGMINDICRIYSRNPNYLRNQHRKKILKGNGIFYDENVVSVPRNNAEREKIVNDPEPCCIISSSGMLTGGPSQFYAEKLSKDKGNFIAITGYQDEESPGRHLLELANNDSNEDKFLKLGNKNVPVLCDIGKYGLSAHADKTEIISAIHSMGSKNVYLVHGQKEVSQNLALELQKEYRRGFVHVPVNGESFDISVKNPRKQRLKNKLKTLSKKNDLIDIDDVKLLWEFIFENYGNLKCFTIEDITFMWYGDNYIENRELNNSISDLINKTLYFEPDLRRPFMFHAVEEEELKKEEEGPMELNKMFLTVDDYFPLETGIYKKGAKFEEKITQLYFDFPNNIKNIYSEKIREFENITGWKIEINSECKQSAAENLIRDLLEGIAEIDGGISFYRNEDLFKVKTIKEIDIQECEKIKEKFYKKTGLNLDFVYSNNKNERVKEINSNKNVMEQNKAFAFIDEKFKDKEDKLYKRSIKVIDGVKCIELYFISPVIANKYRDLIDEIEEKTWWPIKINNRPNQNELLIIGERLFKENNIILKKNLAYLPKEMIIKAVLKEEISNDKLDNIKEIYKEITGLELKIVK
jgi:Cft2 family RNA processing exonuclease